MSDEDLETLADELVACRHDPLRFVETMFDWNAPELKGKSIEPWQRQVLETIKEKLPLHRAVRIARAAGHGVGKSSLAAWITWWAIATAKDCRGILTASNEAQLTTRLRAELRKWFRLSRFQAFFTMNATSLVSAESAYEQTWRIDLLPFNENRPESFAGLHNAGNRILVIMDEASALPAIAFQTLEPIMTDIGTECIWLIMGNPLRTTGPFFEAFHRFGHRWDHAHIDARSVAITDKQQIAEWAQDHEEDSYFFMTRVRGEFPSASALQFIPSDVVEAAMEREVIRQPNDPLVLGVDVARFGDDSSVIYPRRGLDARSILPMIYQGISTDRLEDQILQFCSQNRVEVIFIDGGGVGAGVVDHLLNRHNLPVEDIQFGGRANRNDQVLFANRRAEMWGAMREGLKYLAIPNSSELRAQLIGPEFDYNLKGEIQLEKKSDMKRRGLASPDLADALALTYARPVFPRAVDDWLGTGNVMSDYDPYSSAAMEGRPLPEGRQRYRAPGWARLKDEYGGGNG